MKTPSRVVERQLLRHRGGVFLSGELAPQLSAIYRSRQTGTLSVFIRLNLLIQSVRVWLVALLLLETIHLFRPDSACFCPNNLAYNTHLSTKFAALV